MLRKVASVMGVGLVAKVLNFFSLLLIIRFLSKDDFAQFSVAFTLFGLMGSFVFTALNFGMVREASAALARHRTAPTTIYAQYISLQLLAYLFIAVVVGLLHDQLALWFLGHSQYGPAIWLGTLAGLGQVVGNINLHMLQAQQNFDRYNRVNFVRQVVVLPALALVFAWGWASLSNILWVFMLAQLLPAATYLWQYERDTLRQLLLPQPAAWRQLLSQDAYLILLWVAIGLSDQAPLFLAARYADAAQVADLGVALRYYTTLMLLLMAMHTVLLPHFATLREAQGATGVGRRAIAQWSRRAAWAALPIAIATATGLPLWRLLNGPQYDTAFGLLAVLSLGFYGALLWNISLNVLMAHRDYAFIAIVAVAALLFTACTGMWLVPRWGAWACAGITAAQTALMYFVLYLRVRQQNY